MILKDLNSIPKTDPSDIIRLRDSAYACDLLFTAIGHLDFFSWLNDHPSDLDAILENFKIKARPTDVMLTYFSALGLIAKQNGKYCLTEKSKEHLTAEANWSLLPFIATQIERPITTKLLEVLKTSQSASWGAKKDEQEWAKAMERDDFANMFTAGMDSRGAFLAPGLAKSFDFSSYNSIIDIGGASGIYAACIKDKYPNIKASLLEKPPVDKIAAKGLAKRGLEHKIEVIGADMFKDEYPKEYDIHLYSHVLHDWDIEENKLLIKKSYESLNKDGVIMIHDAHINGEKNGPLSVAEYSVLLMFSTEGKCYSVQELENLLTEAGFVDIQFQPTVGNRSIITGRKS